MVQKKFLAVFLFCALISVNLIKANPTETEETVEVSVKSESSPSSKSAQSILGLDISDKEMHELMGIYY